MPRRRRIDPLAQQFDSELSVMQRHPTPLNRTPPEPERVIFRSGSSLYIIGDVTLTNGVMQSIYIALVIILKTQSVNTLSTNTAPLFDQFALYFLE